MSAALRHVEISTKIMGNQGEFSLRGCADEIVITDANDTNFALDWADFERLIAEGRAMKGVIDFAKNQAKEDAKT